MPIRACRKLILVGELLSTWYVVCETIATYENTYCSVAIVIVAFMAGCVDSKETRSGAQSALNQFEPERLDALFSHPSPIPSPADNAESRSG
jgi:hypothetical protein